MALIENLVVALGLRSKQFDSKIDKSKKKLTGFQKSTSAISTKMKALGIAALGTVAAFASFRSVISNVSSAMQELDVLGKTSKKLGIASEQLMALRLAGSELAGMDFRTFDTALQRMIKRISYAAAGSGEGLAAFKKMGIDVKALKAMQPEKQLRVIADAFSKIASSADKVGIAAKIFDSEGVAMVNVLSGGAAGLDAIYERAAKLGILFSAYDISKVELANDEWAAMKLSIDGAWKSLAIELSPAIIVFSRKMTDLIIITKEWGSTFGATSKFIVGAMGSMVDLAVVLTTQFRLMSLSLEAMGASVGIVFGGGSLSEVADQLDVIAGKMKKVGRDFEDAMRGGFRDKFLSELEKVEQEFQNLKNNAGIDTDIAGGSDKKLTVGALQRGSREAAVAAASAGANDRNVEIIRVGVIKVGEVKTGVDRLNAAIRLVAETLGMPAGIVP